MYSAEVLEHFQNPRNVGDLAEAGVAVELQNPACGDILRLSVKMNDGRVAAVLFRAKGCVPAIACGSRITEMMQDRSLDELRTLTREELVASLGGLPAASIHASHLAVDALKALLKKLG